ncbi:MAG: extensin family protein, partial [Pseudomonadota bacterium]
MFFVVFIGVALGVNQALIHPDAPLPPEWNPYAPFSVAHDPSPLTDIKIRALLSRPGACAEAIDPDARIVPMAPLEVSDTCGIAQRVDLSGVGAAAMRPFQTTCEIALRTALWERHGLQPAARASFGQGVREIRHYSSYNCRR